MTVTSPNPPKSPPVLSFSLSRNRILVLKLNCDVSDVHCCQVSAECDVLTFKLNVLLQAGTFSVASEDVLKNRAIKKAKRRNIGGEVKKTHELNVQSSEDDF